MKINATKAVLTLLTMFVCVYAGYYYAWHSKEFNFLRGVESLLWLALVVFVVGCVLWMAFNRKSESPWEVFGATALGAIAAVWGKDVLAGINLGELLSLLCIIFGVLLFVAINAVEEWPSPLKLFPARSNRKVN